MKINNSLVFGLLCIILCLAVMQIKTCNQLRETENIVQTQYSIMTSKRDAEGRETVSKQVVEAGFDAMRKYYGDSIKRIIDRNTVSLTKAKTKTTNGGTTATTIKWDSLSNTGRISETMGDLYERRRIEALEQDSGRILELPIYEAVYTDKWQTYGITARPDSIKLQHISYNEYSIKTEFARQGKGLKAFFQPKVLQVSIKNENPNTQTLGVDSWHVPVKKNTGLKFGTGILIGAGIGYLLFH